MSECAYRGVANSLYHQRADRWYWLTFAVIIAELFLFWYCFRVLYSYHFIFVSKCWCSNFCLDHNDQVQIQKCRIPNTNSQFLAIPLYMFHPGIRLESMYRRMARKGLFLSGILQCQHAKPKTFQVGADICWWSCRSLKLNTFGRDPSRSGMQKSAGSLWEAKLTVLQQLKHRNGANESVATL